MKEKGPTAAGISVSCCERDLYMLDYPISELLTSETNPIGRVVKDTRVSWIIQSQDFLRRKRILLVVL